MLVAALAAATAVTSPAPDTLAVTLYRAGSDAQPIDRGDPAGFALVTETRRIRLPKGPAVIRFAGVAEGIVPVSAIVAGLPGGTVEKNRDAALLSPAALVDGTLGRAVTLTRTDPATGKVTSEPATIVAGPSPGIVLRTAAGIESLRCAGLPERLDFAAVPAGLSAQPVLSVATVTPRSGTVTVTLSYLARRFDWRASYVATVARDGRSLDLFGWATLANANPQSFPDAAVQIVAGRLNRTDLREIDRAAAALRLVCHPLGTTTSNLPVHDFEMAEDIVVTARRVAAPQMMAMAPPPPLAPPPPPPPPPPEDLGDLKLYRVPARVTVAANGQKQVALLAATGVPFERRYRRAVLPGQTLAAAPTAIQLVVRNLKADRLGLALPAGTTALYADRAAGRLLLGTGRLADRAEGETLRLAAGLSRQLLVAQTPIDPRSARIDATNANPFPVTLDVPIGAPGQRIDGDGLVTIDGTRTWTVTIPANDRATLTYTTR